MKFYIDSDFIKYTNYSSEVDIPGGNVEDGLLALFNACPQLYVHLLAYNYKEASATSLRINDAYILDIDDLKNVPYSEDNCVYLFKDIPVGAKHAVQWVAWVGLTMMTLGTYAAFAFVAMNVITDFMMPYTVSSPQLGINLDSTSSPTYSFSGIRNTTAPGTPIPVCYGDVRVGGHLVNVYTDLTGTDSYLYAQIAVSEGEVDFIDPASVEINDLSVTKHYDVAILRRNGTLEQQAVDMYSSGTTAIDGLDNTPCMYGFNRVETTTSMHYRLIDPITEVGQTPTVVTTSVVVSDIKLLIQAPSLVGPGNAAVPVDVGVYYRVLGASTWTYGGKYTIAGPAKSETNMEIQVAPIHGRERYEVKVIRITPSHATDLTYFDDVFLVGMNEINYEQLLYPHVALLGVRARATSQLDGSMPTITVRLRGIKVKVPTGYNGATRTQTTTWDGTLSSTKQYTTNNAWCLYDLLTNKRYGLGKHYKINPDKAGLVLAQFKAMADHCDDWLNDDGTTAQANADGARQRFSLNLVLDEFKSASEWIDLICASMRANIFYTEGVLWLDIHRQSPISKIFTMSSISKYTQAGASYKAIPNIYEVTYLNKDNNFKIDTFLLETPQLQADYTIEEYKRNLEFKGVTDEKQVKSLTKFALAVSDRSNETITFTTGTQHVLAPVGSVIGISHDVPRWGSSGHFTDVATQPTNYSISLYTPAPFTVGHSYQITIEHKGNNNHITCSLGVATETEDVVVLSLPKSSFTTPPSIGDEYIIYDTTNTIKQVRVTSVKPNDDGTGDITAIPYDENIYSEADNITNMITSMPVRHYSDLKFNVKSSVTGFFVETAPYTDSTGVIKLAIDVYYTVPQSLVWTGVRVAYSYDGGNYVWTDLNRTGHIRIPDVSNAAAYEFVGCSYFKDGTSQSVADALADTVNAPYMVIEVSPAFGNSLFTAGVRGLEVIGSLDGTFLGKDCATQWRPPITLDALAGDQPENTSLNRATTWLVGYDVEILNTDLTRRRITRTMEERFTYTYEMNREDGPKAAREFYVSVVAVDRLGRTSTPISILVSNAYPAAIT